MMDLPREDSPFVLDDRDTLQRLTEFKDYCEKMPFVVSENKETNLGKVLFANKPPEALAKLLFGDQSPEALAVQLKEKKEWSNVTFDQQLPEKLAKLPSFVNKLPEALAKLLFGDQSPETLAAQLKEKKEWSNVTFDQQLPEKLAKLPFANKRPEDLTELLEDPAGADGTLLPHQAFLLAFYKMLETPRQLLNAFPAAHRQLYYRQVLGLTEHGMIPDRVVVSCRLTEDTPELPLPKGVELDAGQDSEGTPRRYQLDTPVLANQGQWTDLRWVKLTDEAVSADKKANEAAEAAIAQYARVLFDAGADTPWPERGARLFKVPTQKDDKIKAIAKQGRVVSSPVLTMSGGTRTVTVTFDGVTEDEDTAFTAQLSSEGKWLSVDSKIENDKKTLTLTVSPELGPITPAPGLDGYPITGPMATAPLLKITRADGKSVPKIKSLYVNVENLPNVFMSTDDGIAAINERSYPFGLQPRTGSGFNLVSPDWYANPFQIDLSLIPQWADLPGMSFAKWYENYGKKLAGDEIFVVSSGLCSASKLVLNSEDKKTTQPLFNANNTDTIPPTGENISVTIPKQGMAQGGLIKPIDSLDPKDGPRWVRVELGRQDFLHLEYPKELAKLQLSSTVTITEKEDTNKAKILTTAVTPPLEINSPYTPQLEALQVSYVCTDDALTDNQYLLTPFGYRKDDASAEDKEAKNPQFYLGFTGLTPGQDLSLYWQLQSPRALEVQWQYLHKDNVWKSLNATVYDQTKGLFESGLWSSPLPHDASADVPWMPSGRYWIRGVVTLPLQEASDSEKESHVASDYPWLFGLHTNSTTATLVDGNTLEAAHFESPLPPFTITQTVKNISGLDEVIQPWSSYGGRGPESVPAFLKRVAKHLEHRGRVLTWRDITILLREKYPEVYDVRIAEPVPDTAHPLEHPIQRMVVIPASGKMDNADRFRPAFNPARLMRMTEFLRGIASPWLKLKLENPTYKDVKVKVKVNKGPDDAKNSGYPRIICEVDSAAHVNPDYAQDELQRALERRYMPWGWNDTSVVKIGAQLDKFEMIKFIQQLDFVNWVKTLTINPKEDEDMEQTTVAGSSTEVLILTF